MKRTLQMNSVSTHLLSAAAAVLVTLTAFASAAVLTVSDTETPVLQFERVVITGQRATVSLLPRVIVVGQRQNSPQLLAAACTDTTRC